MRTCILLFAVLCLAEQSTRAGWGGGSCGPVGPSYSPPVAPPVYSWVKIDADNLALTYGGKQVGGYRISTHVYRDLDSGEWGDTSVPKHPLPAYAKAACEVRAECKCGCVDGGTCNCAVRDWRTHGVQTDRVPESAVPRYYVSGEQVSGDTAKRLVGAPTLPNDADKLRLTVIGDAAQQAKFLADIAPVASQYVVNAYSPSDWQVNGYGFVPGIYLQDKAGKVLHRQSDYVVDTEALRRLDPAYDPLKDPDCRKKVPAPPDATPLSDTDLLPHVCCLGLLGVAGIMAFQKGRKS